jgi:hypothetical protein
MSLAKCPEALRTRAQIRVFKEVVGSAEKETKLRFLAPGSEAHVKSAQKELAICHWVAPLVGLPQERVERATGYGRRRVTRRLRLHPLPSPGGARQHQR